MGFCCGGNSGSSGKIHSIKHFGSAKMAQKEFPKEYLPVLTKLDTTKLKPQFKQVSWSPENEIIAPLDGYRYVYADELYPGSATFIEMQN